MSATDSEPAAAVFALVMQDLQRKDYRVADERVREAVLRFPAHQGLQDVAFLLDGRWENELACSGYRLRATTEADSPFFQASFSNDEFMSKFHPMAARQRHDEALRRSLKELPYPVARTRAIHRVVETWRGGESKDEKNVIPSATPRSLVSLVEIQIAHRRAELLVGVPAIGDRGRGIALVSTLLMFDLAFNHLGLKKLTSVIVGSNSLSHRSTLAVGFTEEGYRKQHLRDPKTHNWFDCRDYGLIDDDFRRNARLQHLSLRLLGRDITRRMST